MVELYGPAFLSAYGDSPSPIWAESIAKLSDDECKRGFQTLASQPKEYPANLTQFVAACRPVTGSPRFLGVPMTDADWKRLIPPPDKLASEAKVDQWIAKLRSRLVRTREPGEEG